MAQVNTLPPAKPDDKVYETPLQIGARVTSQAPAQAPTTPHSDLQNLPIDPAQAATAPYQDASVTSTNKDQLRTHKILTEAPFTETPTAQQSSNKSVSYKIGKIFGRYLK